MEDLSGKTALITGASKGIGRAIAAHLTDCGAHVVAHYGDDRSGAERSVAAATGDRSLVLPADFRVRGAADDLWERALAWRGHIDLLVNNAAVMLDSSFDGPGDEWDEVWHQTLEVNLHAAAGLTRRAVAHFRDHGGGTLIAMSSAAGERGANDPSLVAYAASKAALRGLTQTVARHYARDGVLAFTIAPGVVDTKMSADAAIRVGGRSAMIEALPMKAFVPPEEIAALVAFLAAGNCAHLTGATLDINGASYVR